MSSKGETTASAPRAGDGGALRGRRPSSGRCRCGTLPISIRARSPRAVQADLETAADAAPAHRGRYKGKLVGLAADGAALAEAIAAYETPERH